MTQQGEQRDDDRQRAMKRRVAEQQPVDDDRGDRQRQPGDGEPGAQDVAVSRARRRAAADRSSGVMRRDNTAALRRCGTRDQTPPLRCSPLTRRTVPELARMTMLSVSMHAVLAALDPAEQRAVGDPGGGEDAVAAGHVLERVDAVEVLDPPAPRAAALVVVAEQQAALDLPADAAQRGGGEHAFGRAARADVDVDRRCRGWWWR